jgi:hypothetical protein
LPSPGSVKSLKEVEETYSKSGYVGRHTIPMVRPVELVHGSPLPLHPYLMGALLGNGHFGKRTVRFSSTDDETLRKVESLLPVGVSLVHRKLGDYTLSCGKRKGNNEALNVSRELGLAECKAADKFIPSCYLMASVENRIALLQGLLDTDGSASGRAIEYSTVSPRLKDGVRELVMSLGGTVTITTKKAPKYTYRGEVRTGQKAYRVWVKLPPDIQPFTLSRKASKDRAKSKLMRSFSAIEPAGRKECQCILVGTKRNLYVTDDYIVTHNTFLSLTCLAEASISPAFDDYRFILDDVENGTLMDVERFFGQRVARRLEPPRGTRDDPVYSEKIEHFYYHLDDALDKGRPFIYVLDSMDGLSSEDEEKKFAQHKKTFRKNEAREEPGEEEKAAGSFGDGKAKKNAANLRRIVPRLRKTGSILIIINQTRDNVGTFSFEKKTRSGGHALRFYATLELWSSVREKLKKNVRGENRQTGILTKVQVKKNRQTGRETSVEFPIYYSVGIDDVGGCVDYLIDEKHWQKAGPNVKAPEFDFSGTREKLIKKVEEESLEGKLRDTVAKVWHEVEEACKVERKRRYD